MGSVSVPINNDSKVQPGWIYIKEEKKFYPSKDKRKTKIENTPCVIEVKELPLDELNKLTGSVVHNYWRDDLRYLSKGQSYKMIYCMIRKTKVLKPYNQEGIDYEYASEIYYCYGIMVMLKFYKKYEISLEKIEYILNNWIKDSRLCISDEIDAFKNIHSVNIYFEGFKTRSTYRPFVYQAFGEIIDVFKFIRKNDNLESIKAIVRTLPPNVNNCSVLMCASDDGPRKSFRNLSFLRKLWDGVRYGMGVKSADYEESDSDRGNAIKVLVSIIEANLRKPEYPTTYQKDYCNKYLNSDNNNIADKQSNENVIEANLRKHEYPTTYQKDYCNKYLNSDNNIIADKQNNENVNLCVMSNNNIHLLDQNKSESLNSENNCKVNAITQANTPQGSINSKTFSYVDVPKPAPREHSTGKQTAENSNEAKVEQTKLRDHEAGTLTQDSNSTNNLKASSKMADAATDKLCKKNKKALDSSNDAKKTSSVKKVKLQPVGRCDVESGLTHRYYYAKTFDETGETFKKTLLLFGTDDRGKLSLLNLLFQCSQPDENLKEGQVVDVASDVGSISFYHFLSHGASVEEFIVIITPKLTALTLENLKQLLSDGILNVNALGFVVNSRSETLTSEERSFFNFIRSSFGEVSNHHLMTFLSFCDFSRNFPVLEEMKQQSINSKCTLELYCCELILNDVLEPDDNWSTLIPIELKRGKKVFKTLKNMPLLSVKSMKISQEKSFAATHCADSFKQLVEELELFATMVKDGKDSNENVKPIWRLARLVLTLEGSESSEKNLLDFMAKVLAGIESNGKGSMNSRCFLLLLLSSHKLNFTTTLLSTLDYYYELISSLYDYSDAPVACSVLTETNEVVQFCNNCKDIHLCDRDTRDEDILYVKCLICSCPARSHSLWTFQDSRIFSHSLCDAAIAALKGLCDELPRKHLEIQFSLFLDCLSKTYPKYEMFLKAITKPSN